jgi:hypothetical protein
MSLNIEVDGTVYKPVYKPSCIGCAFEYDNPRCSKSQEVEECSHHIWVPKDHTYVCTRYGWYIHSDSGEVLRHALSEKFGPAPIHVEGPNTYWYLDGFDNPVREDSE